MILILIVVLLVFGLGGAGYGCRAGWGNAAMGPVGLASQDALRALAIVILLVLALMGRL